MQLFYQCDGAILQQLHKPKRSQENTHFRVVSAAANKVLTRFSEIALTTTISCTPVDSAAYF